MAQLLDGTRIYGTATVDTNLTVGGITKIGVYTAVNLRLVAGTVGSLAVVSDSTPGGMLAFWDTTNARWSYVSSNLAV